MQRLIFFFQSASSGGIVLILASLIGIIWANTSYNESYFHMLHANVGPLPVHIWINDVLMAIFFLFVGLEVKREMLVGQLNTNSKRLFPGLGALCGFIVPAIIYYAFSLFDGAPASGWAIPTATDIAFALGILIILESRVPLALKAFLTALAVIDDLMAIVVIAVFYSNNINLYYLLGGAGIVAILMLLNYKQVRNPLPYIFLGILLWLCVFNSGLHATLAGVILALTIPFSTVEGEHHYYPLVEWEHALNNWVTFLVIPIFGFANAGVAFDNFQLADLTNPIVLGIAAGLFIGKQIGVFTLMWSMIKLKIVPMPFNSTWRHIYGISLLCGIGFTMSLFVAMLAFDDAHALDYAKVGVFLGSILSAVCGAIVLRMGPKIDKTKLEPVCVKE